MFEFWFLEFVLTALVVVGVVTGIVRLIGSKKTERQDPMFWKKFGLGMAVALIFPFMIAYGHASFTTEPRWGDFEIGVEQPKQSRYDGTYRYFTNANESEEITNERYTILRLEYDKAREKASNEYEAAKESFHLVRFITMVAFGVAGIVAGVLLTLPAASTGILYGGILSSAFGYIDFWPFMNEVTTFITLLLAFGALMWVSYKKFYKMDES